MAFAYAIALILLIQSSSSSSSSSSSASSESSKSDSRCYESIISFGDSLSDTGNRLLLSPPDDKPPTAGPPYGRTFFHRPTGRYCDGRLVIDFIAQSLGLPFVSPYIAGENGGGFSKGVNFAVAGSTVLDHEFYEKLGFHYSGTNVSLGTQLDWLKRFLATIPDGRKYVERSLVVVGEIGVNDYGHPFKQGATTQFVLSLAPAVVGYIGSTIQELINLGAKTMLVPGNLPLGCAPASLTQFKKVSTPNDYDPKTGCINSLNDFAIYHNDLLQKELSRIRALHPQVKIIYADHYNAAMRFYLSPNEFGFTKGTLRACCGAGGPYNFNNSARCGISPSTCCDEPSSYVSWDGLHFTDVSNGMLTQGLLQGPYTDPQITTLCPSIASPVEGVSREYKPMSE